MSNAYSGEYTGDEVDVVDERDFVNAVKVAWKGSKANILGKAVEYIRYAFSLILSVKCSHRPPLLPLLLSTMNSISLRILTVPSATILPEKLKRRQPRKVPLPTGTTQAASQLIIQTLVEY